MKSLMLSFLLLLSLPGLHAQLSVNQTKFFNQGEFLMAVAPCFGWWISNDPESALSVRSSSLNLGLKVRGEYFLRNNLSVRANVGISQNRFVSRSDLGNEFISTEGLFFYEMGLFYYPAFCLLGGGEVNPIIRPFGGLNFLAQRGGQRLRGDVAESRELIRGFGAVATLGVMIALKANCFMGVEGNVLGFNRRRLSDPDSGTVFSRQNQLYFLFNKAILAITFAKFLNAD